MDTKDENRVEHIEGSHDRSNSEDLEANGPGEMLRAHWKVCLYCICMSSGPLLYGFGLVSVGIVTSLPWFQITYGTPGGRPGQFIIPAIWLGLWNAMLSLTAMIGSYVAGLAMSRIGRRIPFSLAGIVAIGGVLCLYFSDRGSTAETRRGLFLLGKMILGFAMGMQIANTQTYVSEVAPVQLRGPLLALFMVAINIGQLMAVSSILPRSTLMSPNSYRLTFLVELAFAGPTVVMGLIVPESPTYLLNKNNVEKALKSYTRLYGASNADAGVANLQMRLERDREMTGEASGSKYMECFRGTNWRRTRIIAWSNVIPQFLGMTLISNAPYFFVLVGMSPLWAINLTEIGTGINIAGGLLGLFIIAKVGRRTLFLTSTALVGVLWVSVGIGGCFPHSESAMLFVGVMILIIAALLMGCVATVYAAIAAETSATHLRAHSQGIAFGVNGFFQWLFSFFVPYLFNADAANLGGKVGFFFAALSFISLVIGFFEIPDVKGRSFIELDEMFSQRLPTGKFASYKTSVQDQGDVKGESTNII